MTTRRNAGSGSWRSEGLPLRWKVQGDVGRVLAAPATPSDQEWGDAAEEECPNQSL